MDPLTPTVEDPRTPDVHALLSRHFALMRSQSPAESCHVMEPDTLACDDVLLLGLRRNDVLLGIGALARLDATHGELKSMHTGEKARGQGIGRALLLALMDAARAQGMQRISLETGTAPPFAPARALYAATGFKTCAPFGEYVLDPLSVYMTRSL